MPELAPGNVLPYFVIMLVAMASARLLGRFMPPPLPGVPNGMLDAFRGYLAVGVFICHGMIWNRFLSTGQWTDPPAQFYTQIGQAAVVLFFMITAFLFYGKVLDGHTRPMDWSRLFLSRVLRLSPAYLLAVVLLFVLIAVTSGFERKSSFGQLAYDAWRWLTFTIRGDPPLNGDPNTKFYMAGVTWTLVYEWYFYLTLPVLAFLHRQKTPWFLAVVGVLIWFTFGWPWIGVLSFAGGFLAAWLRGTAVQRLVLAHNGPASAISLAAMITTVALFPRSFDWWPNLVLTIAFVPVALGADLFGLLRLRSAETLGHISYSMYLLHGLLLAWFFLVITGRDFGAGLSLTAHWLVLLGLTPVLVTLCVLGYRFVERPAIDLVPACTKAWRRWFDR